MTTCYRCEKCGMVFDDYEKACEHENGEWKTEVSYVKYYYSAKESAEQVFPVDESLMK